MTSTLSLTAAAAFSDHQPTDKTCVVTRTRNIFDDKGFAVAGARVGTISLLTDGRTISAGPFKRLLKTFMFGINRPRRIVTVC